MTGPRSKDGTAHRLKVIMGNKDHQLLKLSFQGVQDPGFHQSQARRHPGIHPRIHRIEIGVAAVYGEVVLNGHGHDPFGGAFPGEGFDTAEDDRVMAHHQVVPQADSLFQHRFGNVQTDEHPVNLHVRITHLQS